MQIRVGVASCSDFVAVQSLIVVVVIKTVIGRVKIKGVVIGPALVVDHKGEVTFAGKY